MCDLDAGSGEGSVLGSLLMGLDSPTFRINIARNIKPCDGAGSSEIKVRPGGCSLTRSMINQDCPMGSPLLSPGRRIATGASNVQHQIDARISALLLAPDFLAWTVRVPIADRRCPGGWALYGACRSTPRLLSAEDE